MIFSPQIYIAAITKQLAQITIIGKISPMNSSGYQTDKGIDLTQPPQIFAAGRVTHGDRPVERYYLEDAWCIHHYSYRATLELDGEVHPLRPGTIGLIPPRVKMTYRFPRLGCRHHYCIFTPNGVADSEADATLAVFGPLWAHATVLGPTLLQLFDRVVDEHSSRPQRAVAALWEMLWRLTDDRYLQAATSGDVADVVAWQVRARLGERLKVSDLAEEAGLSHNQLTRRFRSRFGTTVIGYIKAQRIVAAERMLRETSMPIKVIAMEVGLPDPHQFNKAVRSVLGKSPTQIRANHAN